MLCLSGFELYSRWVTLDRVQFCLENEPNNFPASEFPQFNHHFGLFTVQSIFWQTFICYSKS